MFLSVYDPKSSCYRRRNGERKEVLKHLPWEVALAEIDEMVIDVAGSFPTISSGLFDKGLKPVDRRNKICKENPGFLTRSL